MRILSSINLPLAVLLFSQLFCGILSAQDNVLSIKLNYGFPSVEILAIEKDASQEFYLATNRGLFSYSGSNAKPIIVAGFDFETVGSMLILGDSIWFGHLNGNISLVDIKKGKILAQQKLSAERIHKLLTLAPGLILAATAGDGLYVLNGVNTVQHVSIELSDTYVNDLSLSVDGKQLAVTTDRGVDLLEVESVTGKLKWQKQIAPVNDLFKGVSWWGDVLVITGDETGLSQYKVSWSSSENTNNHYHTAGKIFSGFGKKWILEDDGSVSVWTSDDFVDRQFVNIQGETSNQFIAVFALKEGYMMAWERNGGYRLIPANQRVFESINNLFLSDISSIVATNNNSIWIAIDKGLYEIALSDSGSEPEIRQFIAMPQPAVFPIIRMAIWRNYLLAGSFGDGLYVFNLNNGELEFHFTEDNGLDNSSVLDIATDDEVIWVSTLSGVQQIKWSKPPTIQTIAGAPGYVYDILVPQQGQLFAGSQGESVFVLKQGTLKPIESEEEFRNLSIVSMMRAEGDLIWGLSTESELFNIYEDGLKKHPQPLLKLGIYELVSRVNTQPMLLSSDGLYLPDDKLNFREAFWKPEIFNSDYQHIAATDQSGAVWIATKTSLVRLDGRVARDDNFPVVSLKGVQANHVLSSLEPDYVFAPNETDITLVISAPWYDPYRPLIHEYRLLGLDSIWRVAGTLELFFPKLVAGNYRLELRTSFLNSGSIVSQIEHSFSIALPFYKERWFFVLVALLILFLVIWLVRYREKRNMHVLRAEAERVQGQFEVLKNQINPHFLFNSFNTLASMIGSNPKQAEEYTEKLSGYFREILSVQQDDAVTLKRELELAADFIFLQRSRYGGALDYQVDVQPEYLKLKIPVMALQLLLENAIKHNAFSKSKPLAIRITSANNKLEVSNNLQERATAPDSTGVGLTNLTNRMRILFNSEIEIQKTNDTFRVIIPLHS
jgi:ligand-binding sensor domain-containing protein